MVVLADADKFDAELLISFARLDDLDILATDAAPGGELAERLEAAALRALEIGARNYPSVKSILEKGLDKVPVRQAPERAGIDHSNIRGASYYH